MLRVTKNDHSALLCVTDTARANDIIHVKHMDIFKMRRRLLKRSVNHVCVLILKQSGATIATRQPTWAR